MGQVAKDNIEIGVVLQGGGALGAYEYGAMIALLELMDEIDVPGRTVRLAGGNRGFDWCDQCGVRRRRRGSSRRAQRACGRCGPICRSTRSQLLVGSRKPQSRTVRSAGLLYAAPRCLEFLQLDQFLRYRSDARNAERACGFRFVERQQDQLCRHGGRWVVRRADPFSQSSARKRSEGGDRAAPCAGERQPAAGFPAIDDRLTRVTGTAVSSTTHRSATRSTHFPDLMMSIAFWS